MEENKFKLYEIVKVVDDKRKIGFHNGEVGYVAKINNCSENDPCIYSLFLKSFQTLVEFHEDELESIGEFLPAEEMNERIRLDAIKNKFQLWEIVEILNDRKSNIINKSGFVYDITKDYQSGKWGYGVATLGDDTKYWLDEDHFEKLEGNKLTEKEVKAFYKREEERQAALDEVEPFTWEEKEKIERLRKEKDDSENEHLKIRFAFAQKLRQMIEKKEPKSYIGKWSFDFDFKFKREIDSEFSEVLYTLSLMENSPEMEIGYRELDEISKALMFEEDLSRWT